MKGDERKKKRKTAKEEENDEEEDEEELNTGREASKSPKKRTQSERKAAAATWADDGSLDLYRRRLHELRRQLQDAVDEGKKTFYNNPRPVDYVEEEEQEGENDGDQGGEEGEEEKPKVETGPKFYSPWDVTETASGLWCRVTC